jgi:hypothetical protein
VPFLPHEDRASSSAIPTWRFWAAALSTAALLNTKYSAYLYILAIAVFLAVRRPGLLHDRRTWWALGGALLGLLPTVAWNATHSWASYRWQFAHFARESLRQSSFAGRAWHVVRYLTPPIALLAMPGVTQLRDARRQMLCFPALALALPLLLSPADSPRNVVVGATLLLLLGCDATCRWAMRLFRYVPFRAYTGLRLLVLLVFLWSGVYGVGTVLETRRPTHWPHSSVAPAIRQDSLGWRSLPDLGTPRQAWIFAVDYSIASQLRYYAGQPVQTAWGQYRIWGIPELERPPRPEDQTLIVALSFVEPEMISQRLQAAFVETTGPTPLLLEEGNETKTLNVWRARGRQVDGERFLRMFDLLNLARASQMNGEGQGENL